MALPNDMSRIADEVGKPAIGNTASFTAAPRDAARQLVREVFKLRKDPVDAMASTTTAVTAADAVWMPRAGRLIAAKVIPTGAVTANDTNYATVAISKHDGAGGAATVMASAATTTTDTGSWVAGTEVDLTLSSTLANTRFAAGDVLGFAITKAASGVAIPVSSIVFYVEWEGVDGYGAG